MEQRLNEAWSVWQSIEPVGSLILAEYDHPYIMLHHTTMLPLFSHIMLDHVVSWSVMYQCYMSIFIGFKGPPAPQQPSQLLMRQLQVVPGPLCWSWWRSKDPWVSVEGPLGEHLPIDLCWFMIVTGSKKGFFNESTVCSNGWKHWKYGAIVIFLVGWIMVEMIQRGSSVADSALFSSVSMKQLRTNLAL